MEDKAVKKKQTRLGQGANVELLIYGYLRKKEKELTLYMNIPTGIAQIMHKLYPLLLFRFGDFRKGVFEVDDDGLILKGGDPKQAEDGIIDCGGHFVYADLGQFNNSGLNKGVHLWSIKLANMGGCFASIGVTTEKNDEIINEFCHDGGGSSDYWMGEKNEEFNSWYDGCRKGWTQNEVITVKLDCNNWMVTYYKDEKEIMKDEIECDRSYYFALMCCNKSWWTLFQVAKSPNI